jgi:hypothetical protein
MKCERRLEAYNMTVRLHAIEETACVGVYRLAVEVEETCHEVNVTVTSVLFPGSPTPLLRATGDEAFYRVLGNSPVYPELLKQVARHHQGEHIPLPVSILDPSAS